MQTNLKSEVYEKRNKTNRIQLWRRYYCGVKKSLTFRHGSICAPQPHPRRPHRRSPASMAIDSGDEEFLDPNGSLFASLVMFTLVPDEAWGTDYCRCCARMHPRSTGRFVRNKICLSQNANCFFLCPLRSMCCCLSHTGTTRYTYLVVEHRVVHVAE